MEVSTSWIALAAMYGELAAAVWDCSIVDALLDKKHAETLAEIERLVGAKPDTVEGDKD